VLLLCSRYADFGGLVHRGVGRFFLFSLMRGMEDTFTLEERLPHFVYVDGFDFYAWGSLADLFTMNRKLKIGTTISLQTLSGISGPSSSLMQRISANTPTKLSFGGSTPEDYDWWVREFGQRREWMTYSNDYNSTKEEYGPNMGNVQWSWKDILNLGKQQTLREKECVYKVRDKNGINKVSFGAVDHLPSKYLAPHKDKAYDFAKYNKRATIKEEEKENKKFDPKNVVFEDDNTDPIKTDTTDSRYFFDNSDAISFNLGKKKGTE